MSWTLFAALLPLLVVVKLVRDIISYARHGPYPPGPKPKPLIGNMFDFPIEEASEVYMEWGKKYGSMYNVNNSFRFLHFIISIQVMFCMVVLLEITSSS